MHVSQADHAQLLSQVRLCVPQFPQFWFSFAPTAHAPSVVQEPYAPHAQLSVQVRLCVPQFPQSALLVLFGEQTPSLEHVLHAPHAFQPQPSEHVRIRV
jgi:hypothetical protein